MSAGALGGSSSQLRSPSFQLEVMLRGGKVPADVCGRTGTCVGAGPRLRVEESGVACRPVVQIVVHLRLRRLLVRGLGRRGARRQRRQGGDRERGRERFASSSVDKLVHFRLLKCVAWLGDPAFDEQLTVLISRRRSPEK